MTSKFVAGALVAVGPLLSTLCNEGAPARKSVVVLFDLSESTNKPEMRGAYCENFRTILRSIDHGDALSAGWITERSAAELELPVDTQFARFDPGTTNPMLIEARRARADSALRVALDSIAQRICRKLENPGRKVWQTDIMSSLSLARSIVADRPAAEKFVVIMSDMIEDSDRYDFDTLRLGPQATERIIAREDTAGRLPDLTGVQICVAGAHAQRVERYYEVMDFWRAYFDSAGARVVTYAGPLLRCVG